MWRYNIIGDNNVIISNILKPDSITVGYVLLDNNLVVLKRENIEPILTVKIIQWTKFIDYFGLSIEDDPSRLGKKNVYFSILVIY